MGDKPKKLAWTSIGWMAIGPLVLGYLLSIGPAARFAPTGVLRIYEPLVRACDASPPLSAIKDSYTGLWGRGYRSTVIPGRPTPVTGSVPNALTPRR